MGVLKSAAKAARVIFSSMYAGAIGAVDEMTAGYGIKAETLIAKWNGRMAWAVSEVPADERGMVLFALACQRMSYVMLAPTAEQDMVDIATLKELKQAVLTISDVEQREDAMSTILQINKVALHTLTDLNSGVREDFGRGALLKANILSTYRGTTRRGEFMDGLGEGIDMLANHIH